MVVTASKQRVPLIRYPGSIATLGMPDGESAAAWQRDLDHVAVSSPIVQTTALGPGRNKIFIRGIADSSFNGATQATSSVYFGDVQLGYAGPQPALSLVDIQRTEVLEGPQGTLYGAGSIGGVIRIQPNPVDLVRTGAAIGGGVSLSARGAPGQDLNAVVNLPILPGVLGARIVGYQGYDGGFIDDARDDRRDIGGIRHVGGRAALRLAPDARWTIDASVLGQRTAAGDAGYALAGYPPLTRVSAAAQPYWNSIVLGRLVVTKRWDSGLELQSATGLSSRHAADVFDATPARPSGGPATLYQTNSAALLLTQEARLSRSLDSGSSWVVGVALLRNSDAQDRTIGTAARPTEIIGVTNLSRSASAFGELTEPLAASLFATLGLRWTWARIDGNPSFRPRGGYLRGNKTSRLDPTIGLSWRLAPRVALFGRAQTGFRTGGLAVARGVGRVATFAADSIAMGEIGVRLLRDGPTGLALSSAIAYARWNDIQGDLVDRRGMPFTANIGNARIFTLESSGDWIPLIGLKIDFAALVAHNRLSAPALEAAPGTDRRLPDTPPFSGHVGAHYTRVLGGEPARIGVTVDYIGRSILGSGVSPGATQGNFAIVGADAGWRWRTIDLSLGIENLTGSVANRFALGNPMTLAARRQIMPLRPMTLRIGAGVKW